MAPIKHFLTGRTFGRLHVGNMVTEKKWGNICWKCLCDCGATIIAPTTALIHDGKKSCGCMNERSNQLFKTGFAGRNENDYDKKSTYAAWCAMKTRCYNSKILGFKNHGGRGITVCERWMGEHGFENFLKDMGKKPGFEYSLDRIDNDGNYEFTNCRWATRKQQNNNSRRNRNLTFDGKTMTITCWFLELKISRQTVYSRLSRGWTIKESLFGKTAQNEELSAPESSG
jgi:hypothetical protein